MQMLKEKISGIFLGLWMFQLTPYTQRAMCPLVANHALGQCYLEREGRWWWEDAKAKECGLHKGNITNEVGANVNGASSATVVNGVGDIFKTPTIINLSRPGIENLLKLENRSEPWLVVLYAPWCQFCQGMEASYIELAEKLSGSGVKVAKFRADGDYKDFAKQELQLGSFPTILYFPKHTSRPIKYPSERRDVDSLLAFINALR